MWLLSYITLHKTKVEHYTLHAIYVSYAWQITARDILLTLSRKSMLTLIPNKGILNLTAEVLLQEGKKLAQYLNHKNLIVTFICSIKIVNLFYKLFIIL